MALKQRIFAFTDCDDSLFQTEGKCPPGTELALAATDRSGRPLSFFTPQQRLLLAMFDQVTLIPVTGRNSPTLERVVDVAFPDYRIVSHGALVLDKSHGIDGQWADRYGADWVRWQAHMQAACRVVGEAIDHQGLSARCRIIRDREVPVYVSIKCQPGAEDDLPVLGRAVADHWPGRIHHNGRNMALLPPYADKARAVAFVMERLRSRCVEPPLFLGLGDSLSDLPFMKLCHFALVPRQSQIVERTWHEERDS
ncbi:MAG: hypothetical protein R3310_13265 [Candidatus Competibacteraceae bacterium]|nr:hypothetical protein [Candidatus Competibacteraceae bacterium]